MDYQQKYSYMSPNPNLPIHKYYFKGINPYKTYFSFRSGRRIGYIPSTILVANHPYYHNGEEIIQVEKHDTLQDSLLKNIFETFVSNGINTIETDFNKNNRIFFKIARSFGYEYVGDDLRVSRQKIQSIKISKYFQSINNIRHLLYDHKYRLEKMEIDQNSERIQQIMDFLMLRENISRESLIQFYHFISKVPDRIITHLTIINENNDILGYAILIKTRWDPNTGLLNFFHTKDCYDKELQRIIMGIILNDCRLANIHLIEVNLREDVMDLEKYYTDFGFKFKCILNFEKLE